MAHLRLRKYLPGVPPYLSGFVWAFHPATPGLSPKHTIYTLSIYIWLVHCEKDEIKQEEAGIGPCF